VASELLEKVIARLDQLPPDEIERLQKQYSAKKPIWLPTVGPQFDAYYSPANELLYGGAGGGGKSELGLGLAFTAHKKSLILRRQYVDLGGMTDRAIEINGSRDGFSGAIPMRLRTKDDRMIIFGAHKDLGDEQSWQGQPFDLKVFDEACQHLEVQIQFHLGWLRSASPGQRCRALLASNPPIDASGDWMIKRYRPWLDLTHDKPAKGGELRWFITNPDGEDQEVDGPTPLEFTYKGEKKTYVHKSRTFIPAALKDNPFLIASGYQATLDALPEPLRSAVRDGNFMASRMDPERQVIPSQWVIEAQARWTKDGKRGKRMTALGYDPAGGGADPSALARRYGHWYDELVLTKGAETADGSLTVAHIFTYRRDGAEIVIDTGGGYAGQTILRLRDNDTDYTAFNGNSEGPGRDKSGQLRFANLRAKAWWKFREALDPDQDGGSPVCLPPDQQLRAELTAPTYTAQRMGIQIESKDDIRRRIGRSTNRADAVVMAWDAAEDSIKRRDSLGTGRRSLPTHAKTTRKGALQRRRGY
jgi:hypothetical protein